MLGTADHASPESMDRYGKVLQLMADLRGQGARIIAVANRRDEAVARLAYHVAAVDETHEALLTISEVIPLQLFSYFMAVQNASTWTIRVISAKQCWPNKDGVGRGWRNFWQSMRVSRKRIICWRVKREVARVRTGTIKRLRTDGAAAKANLELAMRCLETLSGVPMLQVTRTCVGTAGPI